MKWICLSLALIFYFFFFIPVSASDNLEIKVPVVDFKKSFNNAKEKLRKAAGEAQEKRRELEADLFDWGKRLMVNSAGKISGRLEAQEKFLTDNTYLSEKEKDFLLNEASSLRAYLESKKIELQEAQSREAVTNITKELKDYWNSKRLLYGTRRFGVMKERLERMMVNFTALSDKVKEVEKSYNEIGLGSLEISRLAFALEEKNAQARTVAHEALNIFNKIQESGEASLYHDAMSRAKESIGIFKEAKGIAEEFSYKIKGIDLKRARIKMGEGRLFASGEGRAEIQGSVVGSRFNISRGRVSITDIAGDADMRFEKESGEKAPAGNLEDFSGSGYVTGSNIIIELDGDILDFNLDGNGFATLKGQGKFWVKSSQKYNWVSGGATLEIMQ